MVQSITISQFLQRTPALKIIDVRTPAEFLHGHIPGASNLPLFSNEERVRVGTAYKQVSKEEAILLGFDLTGPKWSGFIRQALQISPEKKLAIHCWRGGMRSGAMAWALNLYGFEVYVISGGYKSYRRWAYQQFEKQYDICLLGGMTGSGKTTMLGELKAAGEQVLDLEGLAAHQGSVYGSLNRLIQPTQEQFENNMALELSGFIPEKRLWVEDESINIGRCQLPKSFWKQMRCAPLLELKVPIDHRVEALVAQYGSLDKTFLIESTCRIQKRLGPEQYKTAIAAITENRMEDFIRQVLIYYDKKYVSGLLRRPPGMVAAIGIDNNNPETNLQKLLAGIANLTTSFNQSFLY